MSSDLSYPTSMSRYGYFRVLLSFWNHELLFLESLTECSYVPKANRCCLEVMSPGLSSCPDFIQITFLLAYELELFKVLFSERVVCRFFSCFKYGFGHQKTHTLTELNYFWFRKKWTRTRKDTHLENTGNAIQVLWVDGSSYFSQVIILLLPFCSQTFANCNFQPQAIYTLRIET